MSWFGEPLSPLPLSLLLLGCLGTLSCSGTSVVGGGFALGSGGRAERSTQKPEAAQDPIPLPDPVSGGASLSLGPELLAHPDHGDRLLEGPIPLKAHQVADLLQDVDPPRFRQLRHLLVLDARIRAFAVAHKIFVPASDLRLATRREWAGIRRSFTRSGQKDFEAFCLTSFGLSPKVLRSKLQLREARRLLRSYALRFRLHRVGAMTLDFVWARDRAALERFHRRIRSGASFEPLLKRLFLEDPSARGGHLPPLPLDGGHAALGLARSWKGEGPMPPRPMKGPGGEAGFAWLRIRERIAPDPRPFAQMWPDLQKDLARNPVGAGELELFLSDGYDEPRDGRNRRK